MFSSSNFKRLDWQRQIANQSRRLKKLLQNVCNSQGRIQGNHGPGRLQPPELVLVKIILLIPPPFLDKKYLKFWFRHSKKIYTFQFFSSALAQQKILVEIFISLEIIYIRDLPPKLAPILTHPGSRSFI